MTSAQREATQGPVGRTCEVCGHPLTVWRLVRGCSLLKCSLCGHLLRELFLCPAGARDEAIVLKRCMSSLFYHTYDVRHFDCFYIAFLQNS